MRFGRTTPEPSTAELIDRTQERLHVISALADALARPGQLMQIVSTSRDPEDARARIQAAFNLDELQALAILDTQFRSATLRQVERIETQRAELIDELRHLQAQLQAGQ